MAQVAGHLGIDELQAGYRRSGDATLARHYQVIWLLAQGRPCAEVARLTSFARRWVGLSGIPCAGGRLSIRPSPL